MIGETLTHWTIRISLLLYAAALTAELTGTYSGRRTSWIRGLWTVACIAFLAHVAAAFHYYHDWSHKHALDDTARQTQELLGVAFGAGIWFSYLFAAVWLADVAWWWFAAAAYRRRSPWLHGTVHAYMFFIAFNGAIVFEGGLTRWWGIPVAIALAGLLIRRWIGNNGTVSVDPFLQSQPTAPPHE